jgi:hypothetical protein
MSTHHSTAGGAQRDNRTKRGGWRLTVHLPVCQAKSGSLGEETVMSPCNARLEPRRWKSCPVNVSPTDWERVWRGGGVTRVVKRRQRACGRRDCASQVRFWWWPTVSENRKAASAGSSEGKNELTHWGRRAGHTCTGVPQEPGSLSRLLRHVSGRSTGDHGPRRKGGWVSPPLERNQTPRAGTRRRGKPQRPGMDWETSEYLIVCAWQHTRQVG